MARARWANKYRTGSETYALTTDAADDSPAARVQSYADVLDEYQVHPEPKSLAPDGKPAGWHGIGLLARRPVAATRLVHVNKEANELEEKQAGVVHPQEAVNEHAARDAWANIVVPTLIQVPRATLRRRLSGSRISQLRAGTLAPGPKAQTTLTKLAGDFARNKLREEGLTPPVTATDCCAAYLVVLSEPQRSRS